MREDYVHPVLTAHEPRPRWIAVWRFRVIALVVLALLTWATLIVAQRFNNTEQNARFNGARGPAMLTSAGGVTRR